MDLNGNNKQNKNYYEFLQIKKINTEKIIRSEDIEGQRDSVTNLESPQGMGQILQKF
jgi:hypothetical protein